MPLTTILSHIQLTQPVKVQSCTEECTWSVFFALNLVVLNQDYVAKCFFTTTPNQKKLGQYGKRK